MMMNIGGIRAVNRSITIREFTTNGTPDVVVFISTLMIIAMVPRKAVTVEDIARRRLGISTGIRSIVQGIWLPRFSVGAERGAGIHGG
jgi:hypothetical protein